ncbi:MAG TPA: hypothetical protein VJ787_08635 [Thermoleophilia bacterium]|nr:hypothetical protein [Thermoleophilia bacterium]
MDAFDRSGADPEPRSYAEALIAQLGPLDKRDIKARRALHALGPDAVPALLSLALHDDPAASETLSPQVAAALSVLVLIGEPTLDAAVRAIRESDDSLVVANAAELVHRTAQKLGVAVPSAVKEEVERKTGRDWAHVSGEWLNGGGA